MEKKKGDNSMITLRIKKLDGEWFTITVPRDIPIPRLREEIAVVTRVAVQSQRIVCRGKILKDDKKLSDYDIDIDKTVHLVERVDGGQQPIRRSQESAVEQRRDHRVSKSEPLFRSTFHVPIGENGIPDLNRVVSSVISSLTSTLAAREIGGDLTHPIDGGVEVRLQTMFDMPAGSRPFEVGAIRQPLSVETLRTIAQIERDRRSSRPGELSRDGSTEEVLRNLRRMRNFPQQVRHLVENFETLVRPILISALATLENGLTTIENPNGERDINNLRTLYRIGFSFHRFLASIAELGPNPFIPGSFTALNPPQSNPAATTEEGQQEANPVPNPNLNESPFNAIVVASNPFIFLGPSQEPNPDGSPANDMMDLDPSAITSTVAVLNASMGVEDETQDAISLPMMPMVSPPTAPPAPLVEEEEDEEYFDAPDISTPNEPQSAVIQGELRLPPGEQIPRGLGGPGLSFPRGRRRQQPRAPQAPSGSARPRRTGMGLGNLLPMMTQGLRSLGGAGPSVAPAENPSQNDDQWRNSLNEDERTIWEAQIQQDEETQRETGPQRPFSDAYRNAVPAKRTATERKEEEKRASVNALVQENGAGSSLVTTANLLAASQGNIAPTFTQEQTTGLLDAARAEGLEEMPTQPTRTGSESPRMPFTRRRIEETEEVPIEPPPGEGGSPRERVDLNVIPRDNEDRST